jgi:hypothetical protein
LAQFDRAKPKPEPQVLPQQEPVLKPEKQQQLEWFR